MTLTTFVRIAIFKIIKNRNKFLQKAKLSLFFVFVDEKKIIFTFCCPFFFFFKKQKWRKLFVQIVTAKTPLSFFFFFLLCCGSLVSKGKDTVHLWEYLIKNKCVYSNWFVCGLKYDEQFFVIVWIDTCKGSANYQGICTIVKCV